MSNRRPLLGVSACLFRGGAILLVERLRPPFAGKLSLPGGKVEFGERLVDAIRREVREETGLEIAAFSLHCMHEAIDLAEDIHAVIAVHRAAIEVEAADEPLAGDDAKSLGFVPLGELPALESAGRLTDGLAEIIRAAFFSHSADAKQ